MAKILEMLGTFSPDLAESGMGPEWEENVAGDALSWITDQGREALPVLLEHTRAESGTVRAWAYAGLTWTREVQDDPAVQRAFVRGLDDPYVAVRKHAVLAGR